MYYLEQHSVASAASASETRPASQEQALASATAVRLLRRVSCARATFDMSIDTAQVHASPMIYTRQARRADGRAAGGGSLPPYAALLCIIALVQVSMLCDLSHARPG
jgi:hypothetical protein